MCLFFFVEMLLPTKVECSFPDASEGSPVHLWSTANLPQTAKRVLFVNVSAVEMSRIFKEKLFGYLKSKKRRKKKNLRALW